ncbi:MAG: MFS transporter [Anaerolineaceae bacterium]|nr:MAG: MFS transporter [Anaerolineaceae bacterium]
MRPYANLLRENPNFARLWSAQVVSLLGDWFNTIALSILIAQYTGGSGLAISLFLMARFLPPLIFGPFAGVLVDRFDRKRILIYCNALRVFVVLGFLLATGPEMLWLIYLLTVIQFVLSALFEPGQSAIMPAIVKREGLVLANTLTSITWSAMLAVGAIIGGGVAAVFGIQTAIVVDALTFALAAYFISRIEIENPARIEKVSGESGSLLEGLRYLRNNPGIAAVMTVKGGGSIGNPDTIITVYATQVFILGSSGQLSLGILYSAFGVGAILGPLVMNYVNDGSIVRMRDLILGGFVLAFLGWLLLGAGMGILGLMALPLVISGIAIRAAGGSINWTYSSVIIQKTVPDRYLGRVFSLDMAFFQLVTVLSTVLHGWIIDVVNAGIRIPLLDGQSSPVITEYVGLVTAPAIAHNLSVITLWTGVVSLIPLFFWIAVLPRIKRRELAPVAAD